MTHDDFTKTLLEQQAVEKEIELMQKAGGENVEQGSGDDEGDSWANGYIMGWDKYDE